MADPSDDGPPRIALPEPFDRHLRLGPFRSVRDALKFATYAAVGVVPAVLAGPVWWLPFLGGGFVVATYRPDGRPADERAGEFVAYHLRRRHRGGPPPRAAPTSGGSARVRGGRLVAMLEAGGVPVAFLPPADARRLFEAFSQTLRTLEVGVYVVAGVVPVPAAPFRPPREVAPRAPVAKAGYEEMVRLLLRRRQRRRVRLVVWAADGPDALARLEQSVRALAEGLRQLGLEPERLRAGELTVALERLGLGDGSAR